MPINPLGQQWSPDDVKNSVLKRFSLQRDIPYMTEEGDTGTSWMVDHDFRKMVSGDVGGVKLPLYNTTGYGGKAETGHGGWYPFFGIGGDDWLNKTHGADQATYWDSPEMEAISKQMDAVVGDRRFDRRVPKADGDRRHVPFINAGLPVPPKSNDGGALPWVQRNVDQTKRALAVQHLHQARVDAFNSGMSPSLSTPIDQASSTADALDLHAQIPASRIRELQPGEVNW